MKNLKLWNACQSHLPLKAKIKIDKLTQVEAMECVKNVYPEQTAAARNVLEESSWLPSAGIVEYLFDKYPDIICDIKNWWSDIETNADAKWVAETGQSMYR